MKGIADFEFTRRLGQGPSGTTWLASSPPRLADRFRAERRSSPNVVVKVVQAGPGGSRALDQMATMVSRIAQVSHRRLVPAIEVGRQGTDLYLVSLYYPHGPLLNPSHELKRSVALRCVGDAARAAHALHEAGIPHGAIRPSNILIEKTGGMLTDATLPIGSIRPSPTHRQPDSTIRRPITLRTLPFEAPEVLQGKPPSRASDIWALGASLHQALTKRSIYPSLGQSKGQRAMRTALKNGPQIDPTLTPEERMLVQRTLSTDPRDRPLTALEVADVIALAVSKPAEASRA